MKLNIAFPATGAQKSIDIDDEHKLHAFYDKRMGSEINGESIGDEFKGYIFRITGGHDKDGFTMKQGVLVNGRVRLLLAAGTTGFAHWRGRDGERKRRSVRGCIVGPDIRVLHLTIVKKSENATPLPGITDKVVPKRLGPKRASKIRKLFGLSKEDDVRKFVIRREVKGPKDRRALSKAPKIQRLVTPLRLQRKRRNHALKIKLGLQQRKAKESYASLLKERSEIARIQVNKEKKSRLHSIRSHTPLSQEIKEKKKAAKQQKLEARKAKLLEKKRARDQARLAKKKAATKGAAAKTTTAKATTTAKNTAVKAQAKKGGKK